MTTVFNDADLLRLENLLTPCPPAAAPCARTKCRAFRRAGVRSGRGGRRFLAGGSAGRRAGLRERGRRGGTENLLQKLYDATAAALAAGDELDLILYAEDDSDSDEPDYWPWANAFLYALDVVDTDWFEVADEDEGFESLMMPMLVLGGAFEQEDGEDLLTFSDEEVEGYKEELLEALGAVHTYWRAKAQAPSTVRREGDKVGRNDACPCGSGKKYKACCGRN